MSTTTDRANVVVSSVVEDTFPAASAERKMELVEAWERVLDNWKPSAEDIEADGEADLVAALWKKTFTMKRGPTLRPLCAQLPAASVLRPAGLPAQGVWSNREERTRPAWTPAPS